MFVAKRIDGEQISLISKNWTRKELEADRKRNRYYCPLCKQQVILKLGYKQTWHFAHHVQSNCESSMRGETEVHHKAKWLIYKWLKSHGFTPLIEHYLPQIKQRPDVMVQINNQTIVFEVQQGEIPLDTFRKRQESYTQLGFQQVWVGFTSINEQELHYSFPTRQLNYFLMRFDPTLHAIYLNVNSHSWVIYKDFRYISPQKVLAQPHFYPLSHTPNELFQLHEIAPVINKRTFNEQYFSMWIKEIRKKRLQVYLKVTPTERFMLRLFQQHHLNLNYFPALASIPLKTNINFITSPLWWQSWLILTVINVTPLNESLTISKVVKKLDSLVQSETFHLRSLNKPNKTLIREAVMEYFRILETFTVLRKKFNGVYEVKRHIHINKHLDTLCMDDIYVQKIAKEAWYK